MSDSSLPDPPYYLMFLTISEHPNRPLDGHRLVLRGEIPDHVVNFQKLKPVYEAAHHRFDISQWSKNLYIGRLYVTEDAAPAGVAWEDSPQPRDHDFPENPVETLPDDLTPISEIPPAAADELPDLN